MTTPRIAHCFWLACLATALGAVAEPPPDAAYRPAAPTTLPSATAESAGTFTIKADHLVLTLPPAAVVPTAYLGAGFEPPKDALRSQLKLPQGVGLVVNYVDSDGPSKQALHLHDVLERLDDQLLVNADQLSTLVRLHKAGDVVRLSLVREGAPAVADVKLGQREAQEVGASLDVAALQAYGDVVLEGKAPGDRRGPGNVVPTPSNGGVVTWLDNLSYSSQTGAPATIQLATTQPTTGPTSELALQLFYAPVARASAAGPVTIDDGQQLMWLQAGEGGTQLTVVDRASGQVKFKGPIGSEQQWKQVPQDVRTKFESWRTLLTHAPEPHGK